MVLYPFFAFQWIAYFQANKYELNVFCFRSETVYFIHIQSYSKLEFTKYSKALV